MTDDVVIRGGAGGIAATLEDLRRGADALRAAADLLEDAEASAAWADREGLDPGPGSWVTYGRAQAVLAPVLRGPASLGARAADVRALATALLRAADALEEAEGDAADAVRSVLAVAGHQAGSYPVAATLVSAAVARVVLPGLVIAGAWLHRTGRGPDVVRQVTTVDPGEHAVQALAGVVRGLAPGAALPSPVPAVGASRGVTTVTSAAGTVVPALARRPLQVTARLGPSGGGPTPTGSADLLARIGGLYPHSGGTAGTVAVDRLDHPDGRRTWVVAIPGTQSAAFGTGANPMDMATNVRVMAAAADDSSELVTRALEQAGARPGEQVLLTGHSQGGMVAMALAGSGAFTARHRVAAVLTAGSPVATQQVPAGTAVLHLEHRQDLVPALDGWRNPDRAHRTTAVRDLSASPVPEDRLAARSPGAAHGVDAYTRTAAVVTAVGGPSVRAWERAAGPVLGGPGVTVVRHEFTGERAPVPAARERVGARAAAGVPAAVPGPDGFRLPGPAPAGHGAVPLTASGGSPR